MNMIRLLALAIVTWGALCSAVWAQAGGDRSLPFISKTWHALYEVNKEGSVTETFTFRNEILHESALERLKVFGFSFSSSIQSGEVLEAYTQKKDGRRIPVPPTNYQNEVNDGRSGASPMFSDRSRMSVVFPDVAVGDTVGVSYRVKEKEPMFPGHFSLAHTWSPYLAYEDAQITIRADKGFKLSTEFHGVQELPTVDSGETRTLQWRYSNLKPRKWSEEDEGIWRIDESPAVLASTFASYEAIAKAYGDRASPKAEPTARIRELAQQVIGAEARPRERARLAYEWVSKNITYGGNCIGVGAVVPRDLDLVLDNKMGDCKDHATLLQALLSAAGIRSEQVLVNSGGQYDLPRTPVVSLVNHVMTYLPDFKLYADATAKEIPFGYLPMGAYAKPVIHVGAATALAQTPNQQHEQAEQKLHMTLKLRDDGSAIGDMRVALKGLAAADFRARMRSMTADSEADMVKRALAGYGYKGKGTLSKGDTSGMSDHYAFSLQFEIESFLEGGASGAFVLSPVVYTPMSVMNYSDMQKRNQAKRPHNCYGFHSYETYEIHLPPRLSLTSLPAHLQTRGRLVDYTAKYQRTKTGLLVTREVHDKTPESICTPEATEELRKQALPAAANLKTQVLYKLKPR